MSTTEYEFEENGGPKGLSVESFSTVDGLDFDSFDADGVLTTHRLPAAEVARLAGALLGWLIGAPAPVRVEHVRDAFILSGIEVDADVARRRLPERIARDDHTEFPDSVVWPRRAKRST